MSIFQKLFKRRPVPNERMPIIFRKTPEEIAVMFRQISAFPVKKLTKEEFAKIPQNVDENFLKFCPIGSWFVCTPMPEKPDLRVIGQIVKGEDLLCEQYGAGLLSGPPARGINRYRLKIAE